MVDADKEKISKSKQGAYEKPQTADAYVKKYGADIVRLWVASQDYRNDIVVSEERIGKVGETYRLLRNTLRYQLSNLFDFDPARNHVPDESLTGLDRWILDEFATLEAGVIDAYNACEFHVVYQKLSQFAAVQLSSIHHDLVKDRLYTDAAGSPRRRSTQTTLYRMAGGLCQMLAPILAFTADEAWEFLPGRTVDSVHLLHWLPHRISRPEEERRVWEELFRLRASALPSLEEARQARRIGKALDAKLILSAPETERVVARENREALRELLNVSQLEINSAPGGTNPEPRFEVRHADGHKCARCWHWETDVGSHSAHPTLCGRCVQAIGI
jgi:isoleucyl-tRNA synthetase